MFTANERKNGEIMVTIIKEKKRRGLSMIVNQFSGKSRNADAASLENVGEESAPMFVKDTAAKTQGIRFQNTKTEIKFQNTELESTTADSAVVESPTLTHRLNAMIAAGVSFEIAADTFEAFGTPERENAFLRENKREILFTLQRGFLIEYFLKPSPELLKVFSNEVNERSAIMSDVEDDINDESLRETTAKWISEQIEKL